MGSDRLASYRQATDPGDVGAGVYWLDTTSGLLLKRRNEANAAWETVGPPTLTTEQVQDIAGVMLNPTSPLQASYDDTNGLVDLLLSGEYWNPEFAGHITTEPAVGASFAPNANAGTTGSTASSFGNDIWGFLQLVPGGTGIAAGVQVAVTFANARGSGTYGVWLMARSSAAEALSGNVNVTSLVAGGFSVRFGTAPTSGQTYQFVYLVVGE